MKHPETHRIKEKAQISMINKDNFQEQLKISRPVSGVSRGFGATLPQHDFSHGKGYFVSEYRDFWGKRPETATDA